MTTLERLAYSLTEAAQLSGRSDRTLRRMCAAGKIGRRDGAKWYISNAELHELCKVPLNDIATQEGRDADTERRKAMQALQRWLAEGQRLLAELE